MERFTISIDEDLAAEFDRLITQRGYLERERLERDESTHCVASLSYVYNHHERELAERLTALQHDHHDLTVATMHVHLDHEHCLESVILRGQTAAVRSFAEAMVAERGVRHGQINLVAVEVDHGQHAHGYVPVGKGAPHLHLKPKT